jgi:uncharacterized protein with von Willebrand factor type A (vWA) domain
LRDSPGVGDVLGRRARSAQAGGLVAVREDSLVRELVSFGRILRSGGAEVGPGRVADAARALAAVGARDPRDVYFALRQTLVCRQDELELFDRALAGWVRGEESDLSEAAPAARATVRSQRHGPAEEGVPSEKELHPVGASTVEMLRRRDFATLDEDELAGLMDLLAELGRVRPQRRSRRLRPHSHGDRLDLRRLARRSLRSGGEPVELPGRIRKVAPRKLIVLCDVSGSMAPYARALLLFLHATAQAGRVEAFVFGTRLARLTGDLATRDPDVALGRVTGRVVDWGSGTRIGASLKQFNDEYGRRALSRGAVVVIASDGWERDDPALLGREMARLSRAAYAVVWVNPLQGSPGFEPLAAGMQAALPFVDRFLPGHNLESLEGLAGVVAGIERRHAA